ncbi:MAG: fumarylacetoacetate hydrolase family protein [Gammaproteobacteria bacterium]|nr:fumarylacetoacetate hydrolase family protein [Gammaproteobacteria bacterium]MDH5345697.1 fumarylacetoacetate hydrolase family protein [Gammaproteobacteria bacterium]
MDLFRLLQTTVPVAGTDRQFPVRRIYCVGRNYEKHVAEMGHDVKRSKPFYFAKPADAIVLSGGTVDYPPRTGDLHHEIELVVAIGKAGSNVPVEAALDHVFGYAVGIDLTRRDLQHAAKEKGQPWETAKGFDQSAPITAIHPAASIGHRSSGRIWLAVNGEIRQDADLGEQIWNVQESVAELSSLFELAPGDLLYTGTPAGVGPLEPGDEVTGGIAGIDEIRIRIA